MNIKIGGHKVDVRLYDQFDSCVDNVGTCIPMSNLINVVKRYDSDKLHAQCSIETLLHEVLHFIDFVYCGYVFEEEVIKSVSKYLFQIFNDNDLFNFPDEVKLVGFDYWVRYGHEFAGDINKTYVDVNQISQTISVGSKDTMCDDYVQTGLLIGILIMLNNDFVDSDVFRDGIHTFAQGLFQVMKDNKKFRKLFRWGQ
ncbi:MAG: hypothetical protein U9N86_08855 [Bacteroidota bacterium]|nr:hypothetical protein [Bacteroidota bacterium]